MRTLARVWLAICRAYLATLLIAFCALIIIGAITATAR